MLALVLDNSLVRLQRDRERPLSGDGLVGVSTRIAGICNTDLELAGKVPPTARKPLSVRLAAALAKYW
ncbi:MAG: hypothetical protein H8E45_02060 [Proteobacteria bacterium]|nr:hypothetical protein [Pseudomonadota bacterium]